jgi:hypothetical protein
MCGGSIQIPVSAWATSIAIATYTGGGWKSRMDKIGRMREREWKAKEQGRGETSQEYTCN